jgi:hypothetical protein
LCTIMFIMEFDKWSYYVCPSHQSKISYMLTFCWTLSYHLMNVSHTYTYFPISNFHYILIWENVSWCVLTFLVRLSLNNQANLKEMSHSNCCYPSSCNEQLYPHSNFENKPRLHDICTCWRTKIVISKTN